MKNTLPITDYIMYNKDNNKTGENTGFADRVQQRGY